MKKILCIFTMIIVIAGLSACSSEYDQYIEEVKTGCLGGCLDVTVDEVFSEIMPEGKWDGGETDDGKIIVEYKSDFADIETTIQLTVIDENHFSVSGISVDGILPQSDEEGASIIEGRYTQYYGSKYPDKAAIDFMPNEPVKNIMDGISAIYAEKARNPIDIANYLDKPEDEIKTALGVEDKDEFLTNSEISLMYDAENSRIDNVIISGSRIYSLFGVQTYQTIDEALNRVSDRFEKVSEQDGMDGTMNVMLIRNNSEDALTVTYDTLTGSITEVAYMYNGLEGYRAEQERLKKEAEEAEAKVRAKSEADEIEAAALRRAAAKDAREVLSGDEAIAAVEAYGEMQGWSEPYDMYEAHDDGDVYLVFAGHSYLGSDWIKDTYRVPKNNKDAVELVR